MTPEQPTLERAIELLSREAPSTEGDGSYWRRWASDLTWIVPRYWPLVLAELTRLRERNAALEEALQRLANYAQAAGDCPYPTHDPDDECDHRNILLGEVKLARALLAEPVA